MISQGFLSLDYSRFVGDSTGFEKHHFPEVTMMYHSFVKIHFEYNITMFTKPDDLNRFEIYPNSVSSEASKE